MAGPTLSAPARAGLAARAESALAPLGVGRVHVGEVLDGGSLRSLVVRALAEPRRGDVFPVILKAPLGSSDRLIREQAALTLAGERRLPGTVRLLGVCEEIPLLVLEDLGEAPSVADRLLGDDREAAADAVIDWAAALGALQAASAPLHDAFAKRLEASATTLRCHLSRTGAWPPAADPLVGWLGRAAERLPAQLTPFGLEPSRAALDELRSFTAGAGPFVTSADGLVPGDSCPDNALFAGDRLTLIDFESAAHRHIAWEAAYLIVPWPTCWCSWALPDEVRDRALARWRLTVAPALPEVASDAFDEDLARAVIGWMVFTLGFLMERAVTTAGPPRPSSTRPRPDLRTVILHRLGCAAELPTAVLPALRELAAQLHVACRERWGEHRLALAPAFGTSSLPGQSRPDGDGPGA